jgi:hypothetical protein
MKRRIRIESIRVVHPAKTRSTRALVLGNVLGYSWKYIKKLWKRKFDAFDRPILSHRPFCCPSSHHY